MRVTKKRELLPERLKKTALTEDDRLFLDVLKAHFRRNKPHYMKRWWATTETDEK
jgi:hypothetical protein